MKCQLLIIDPQNSFCYPGLQQTTNNQIPDEAMKVMKDILPEEILKEGELFVPGAFEDMTRLANLIKANPRKFDDINVTMDSHHQLDIAHSMFWTSGDGKTSPAPFTIITKEDVEKGTWRASIPIFQKHVIEYTSQLEANGRYPLCIWPDHCLIGTFGHNIIQPLKVAFSFWERERRGFIEYVTKGSNYTTEHYSAVIADVPDPNDINTNLNKDLIDRLDSSDMIIIAGEARSHCVANTIRDIANEFGDEKVKKMVLLEDAMSDVPGFEDLGQQFMDDMTSKGVKIKTTENIFS